jgi:hypothetical protein
VTQKHLIMNSNPCRFLIQTIFENCQLMSGKPIQNLQVTKWFSTNFIFVFPPLAYKELNLPPLGLNHKHHPTISGCKPLGLHYFHKNAMEQSMHSIWIINIMHQLVNSMTFQSLLCYWLLLGWIHRVELCSHL